MVSPAERNNLERPQTKVLKLSKNEKKKRQQILHHVHVQDRATTSTVHEVEKTPLTSLALPVLVLYLCDHRMLQYMCTCKNQNYMSASLLLAVYAILITSLSLI